MAHVRADVKRCLTAHQQREERVPLVHTGDANPNPIHYGAFALSPNVLQIGRFRIAFEAIDELRRKR